MAQNFPYWFAGNFQKFVGRWGDMPVDAHMLIALSAPRPVFITGGTQDQWADPVGEFKAEVAAGPVYKLLGKKDLGVTDLPPLDKPVIDGDLGWHYHTGGHAATEADWKAFLDFLGKSSSSPFRKATPVTPAAAPRPDRRARLALRESSTRARPRPAGGGYRPEDDPSMEPLELSIAKQNATIQPISHQRPLP